MDLFKVCVFACVAMYVCRVSQVWSVAYGDVPSCPLPNPLHSSAAGQFFPEAAQVAYQMWELSAVARVEVRPPHLLLDLLTRRFHCSARTCTLLLFSLAPSCPLVASPSL